MAQVAPCAPTPDGTPLTVQVACRSEERRATRHEVVIDGDWVVTVPHDLAEERAAVARGGRRSCVDLVERTVPALRDLVQLRARRTVAPLRRNHAGRWVVTEPTAGCGCVDASYGSPADAAAHVRSAAHLAPRYGADATVLDQLARAVEAAHGSFAQCPPEGWTALGYVREARGLDALWEAGVPPELVIEVQDAVLPRGGSLPVQAYLGAVYHCRDLDWLATTVARRPEPEVATWAAWGFGVGDRSHPHLRGQWLARGVERATVGVLVDGGITVRLARELGEATGRTVRQAAEVLAAWERAGCRPGPGDIAVLDAVGLGDHRPVPTTVSALHRRAESLPVRPTRTQVAVLLALAGSRQDAWRLLRDGVVTGADALSVLAPDRTAVGSHPGRLGCR